MEFAPEKKTESDRRSGHRWAFWTVAVAAAAAVGIVMWGFARDRARELGRRTAEEAVVLMAQAHEARAANRMEKAEELLDRVRSLLERAEPRSREPLYTTVLIDLASLKIASERPGPEAIVEARELLNEAWELSSPADVILRHRIATARGLAEVLGGDITAARQWYEEALALIPSDEAARAKLMLLDAGRSAPPSNTAR